jgi:hypothetical protein
MLALGWLAAVCIASRCLCCRISSPSRRLACPCSPSAQHMSSIIPSLAAPFSDQPLDRVLQLIDQLDRLASVRLVTTFSPAAEGPDVTANRTAISSSAATAYTPIAMAEAYSRLPLLATIP